MDVDGKKDLLRKRLQERVRDIQVEEAARNIVEDDRARKLYRDFDIFSVAEMYQQPPFENRFLVEDLWPSETTCLLAAQAKTGKTTLVMNLLWSLLTEEPFLGHFPVNVVEGTRILVLNLELPTQQYTEWLQKRGIPPTDRLFVANMRGLSASANVTAPSIRKLFLEKIEAVDPTILIIDPIGPVFRTTGQSEDDNPSVGRVLDAVDGLRNDSNIKEIMVVQHAGHDRGADRPSGARGASAWNDVPSALWTYDKEDAIQGVRARTLRAEGRLDKSLEKHIIDFDSESLTCTLGESFEDYVSSMKAMAKAVGSYRPEVEVSSRTAPTNGIGVVQRGKS